MSSPTGAAPTAGASSISSARRSWDVLLTLTRADLRDSRDLSALGLLKWLLEPLAALAAYLGLLAGVLGHTERAYPLFILIALIPFRYFSGSISSGLTVVPSYGRIIAAYPLPRGVIPLVPVVAEGASFLVSLLLVVPFAVYFGTGLSVALLWLPVVLVVFAVLTAGPVYLAAVYGLYLPDFRGVAQNLLRLSFLTSTGLVALRRVPGDNLPRLFRANPLSGIFDSFRAIVIGEHAPAAIDLLYPLGVGLFLLAAGLLAYRVCERNFPKEV
jgi:ABC-2 type transport system permease protein